MTVVYIIRILTRHQIFFCIFYIMPGSKFQFQEMNDRLMVPEMKKKLCWTQECIDAFTTILSSAKNIYFMPTNRNIDGYIGELVYLWERSISSMLIDMGYAKRNYFIESIE